MRSSTNKRSKARAAGTNRLFPIFVKLEGLNVVIVGGGKVALEKLTAILHNSPSTSIRIVSKTFLPSIRKFATRDVKLFKKEFQSTDINGADLVFSAVNDVATCKRISVAARKQGVLHNAADKPDLCDFYLGSIVQKGNLKIGISTNGKSPTLAKRLKAILESALPDEIDETLRNLSVIRRSLKGDLKNKAKQLNLITSILVNEPAKISEIVRGKKKGGREI